ncbi:RNA polymerase sigma-70 factor [Rapidithrix thailandica]|uniref:RNA polymerase sigma-70 factor n=1 Tax=Rapidithrix thailandica TaxID=413964 RepID=A0AAW9SGD8_9BACT
MKQEGLNIESLLHRIGQNNDEAAFKELFHHFYARLIQYAITLLQHTPEAEEVVLDVFTKVWNKRGQLNTVENFEKYLYISVKNRAIDQLRKRKNHYQTDLPTLELKELITHHNPEKALLEQELLDKINKAILNLPEKSRMVYRMVKEEGLKYKEVAELLELSPKTVDNHITTAMKKIRLEVINYLGQQQNRPNKWEDLNVLLLLLSLFF